MTDDLRTAIAEALTAAATRCDGICGLTDAGCYEAHPIVWSGMAGGRTHIDGEVGAIADIALAAIQSRYVPPPPGSGRDKLPDHVLAAITPWIDVYLSTGCETAHAIYRAISRDGDPAGELDGWAQRMHASCRRTRKQDMVSCICACHQGGGR
jgi:hypothetical protein